MSEDLGNGEGRQTVLVVDDIPENIDVLYGILKDTYKIKVANKGRVALAIAAKFQPDIILLDIMMPEMDGFEVCAELKKNPFTKNIPVIFVTANDKEYDEARGFELGAVDYITKPVKPIIVKARVKTQLALYDQNRELARQVAEKTREVRDSRLEIIRKLGIASEFRDNETGAHILRMSKYSYHIAKACGLPEEAADNLLNAAPMHDIGKIGIPDSVLLKPGRLNEDEWAVMQQHSDIGSEIIGEYESELLLTARVVAQQHHEKWNGRGYPNGLSGSDIDIHARIVAVADVFDALTSKRPYKEPWDTESAVNVIKEESGQHFDPDVVKGFISVLPEILKIREQHAD